MNNSAMVSFDSKQWREL